MLAWGSGATRPRSWSNIVEAVARFDAEFRHQSHPRGWQAATLGQVIDAHREQREHCMESYLQTGARHITVTLNLEYNHGLPELLGGGFGIAARPDC